jgi:3-oxoacyl-[acyl-carrier protein] reductase
MTCAAVTGASRGIGRATALRLAERGVHLALLGRPSADLERTLEDVRALGVEAEAIPCDLGATDPAGVAARRVLDRFGPPDAVIHNAATIERAPIAEMTVEAWDVQLAVNVRGPFLLTRALLPSMVDRHAGRHVYVSSISATLGTAGSSAYCASKWALVGFVKSLAEELSGTGLSAVAVLPGSVGTRMLEGSGFSPRMTPDDVARTLVFHALDAPAAHNGAIIEMFGT